MASRFIEWGANYFFLSSRRGHLFRMFLLVLAAFIVAGIGVFEFSTARADLTRLALSERESLAHLGAFVVGQKFNNVENLAVTLADRQQVASLASEERWEDVARVLRGVPDSVEGVNEVFLFNDGGVLVESTVGPLSETLQAVTRVWFQSIQSSGDTFITPIYKDSVTGNEVIAVVAPIFSDSGDLLGALAVQVQQDFLLGWLRSDRLFSGATLYLVDSRGDVAGYPYQYSKSALTNFSQVPAVQRVVRGDRGIEVIEHEIIGGTWVRAYEPVFESGWGGVVVEESALTVFSFRNLRLLGLAGIYVMNFVGVVGLSWLLTRFIKIIGAYRQQEKAVLESAGDGLVAIDRLWRIVLWNKAATDLLGWTKEEALGKKFSDVVTLIKSSDRSDNIEFIEEAMLHGESRFLEDDALVLTKSGAEVYVGNSAGPILDEEGVVEGAIVVFRDISERRALEQAKDELHSLAVHQLRGPVTVIKGYLQLLQQENVIASNPAWEKYLTELAGAGNQLGELVDALLDVSRMERARISVTPEAVQVTQVADAVLKSLMPEIDKKRLVITKKYENSLPDLMVDRTLIKNICENLLTNAVKYTPELGEISVAVRVEHSFLVLSVSDTGCGIPGAEQSKIFQKFFRSSNVANSPIKGTGLGLYMVKRILDQSGGSIRFESKEHEGTTFYVSIPLSGMRGQAGVKGLS